MNASGLIRKTLILLFAMLAIVIGVGYALPGTFHVERTLVIERPPSAVFPMINDLSNWEDGIHGAKTIHILRDIKGSPGLVSRKTGQAEHPEIGSIQILESQKERLVKLKLTTGQPNIPVI